MKPNNRIDKRSGVDAQLQPLAGETTPEDARRKALHFGVVGKLRLEAARRTSDDKTGPKSK